MTDPFLDSLATALAGQAATALGTAGRAAVQKIRDLLSRRAAQDPETQDALEAARQPSAEPEKVRALAERLDRVAGDDPELAELISTARTVLQQNVTASDGGVVNQNTGTVEKLIQAQNINGPITFN